MKNPPSLVELELLARCSLLSGLPRAAQEALLQAGARKRLAAKKVAFSRGDAGSDICFLLDGGVKVSTLSREGKEIIFDVLVAGDFFGEMSLFDGKPRTGTVTTLVPSLLLCVGKEYFLDLLGKHPEISLRLIQTLISRLRLMDRFVEDVLFLDAEARLAKRLVALASMFGSTGENGEIRIDLKVSQQELANLVGITRESVNKQFREWERSGVVGIDGGCLVLRRPQVFAAMLADGGN